MLSAHRHRVFRRTSVLSHLNRAARLASVELLEHRRLLSAVVVNTTVDQTDAAGSSTVSLRDALAIASNASSATTITFDPTVFATQQTITLTNGELDLSSSRNVTITGPSAGLMINANASSSVLVDDASAGNVSLSNVTLTDGLAGSYYGGGLVHEGNDALTLTNVTISANTAYYDGGGIYNTGTLVIDGSSITGNTVTNLTGGYGAGGGIDNNGGTLTVTDSTISGNVNASARSTGGAGISNRNGIAKIVDSTVSGNSNYADPSGTIYDAPGGGVFSTGTLTVTNSTISGNTGSLGGGVYVSGSATIEDSTISGNAGQDGGGAYFGAATTLGNSVISGNTYFAGGASPDVTTTGSALNSQGNNFVGMGDGSSGWVASDQVGLILAPLNAGLGTLANNGGPTLTMLPQTGSPLIDAGSNALIPTGVTTDQRGFSRIFNTTVDIGAVETQPTISITAPGNQSAIAGQSQTFTLGSFTELGATAPFTVSVNWGDGSTATSFSASTVGVIAGQSHTYAASGTDTVTITVTDSSGLVTNSANFSVAVSGGLITVTPPANQTAFVGISQSFTLGSFTDTNATAPFAVDVNWGDGSTDTTFSASTAGTIASQSHTYEAAGNDTVEITVTDASGTIVGTGSFTAVVSTGLIVVTPPSTETAVINLNSTFNLGSFTATNAAGPYSVVVIWGDGSSNTTFTANAAGTLFPKNHTYTAEGTDPVTVTVTDASGTVTGTATFNVDVSGAEILVTAPATQTAFIDTSKSFSLGSFIAVATTSPFAVDVNWGDGSTDTTFSASTAGNITSQPHTYSVLGTQTVTVTITDASGMVTGNGTFTVDVITGSTPSSIALQTSSSAFQSGQSDTLTAMVSPSNATGSVTFLQNGQAIGAANISGGTAVLTTAAFSVGGDTITAVYSGNATYTSSTAVGISVVVSAPPVTTTLSLHSTSTDTTTSQSITLTATLTPNTNGAIVATGEINFYQDNMLLGTGTLSAGGIATLTTSASLPVGTDSITAAFAGSTYFTASTSASVSVLVNLTASSTSLTSSSWSKTIAQELLLKATVGPEVVTANTLSGFSPTGTVTFSDAGTIMGTVAVGAGGVATFAIGTSLPLGVNPITATYNADSAFAASASATDNLSVTTHALVPVVTRAVAPASAIGGVRIHGSFTADLTNELDNIETGSEVGTFSVSIFASATTTLDTGVDPLVATVARRATIREGKSHVATVPITSYPTTLSTGMYHLLLETTDALGNTEEVDTGQTVQIIAPVVTLSASFVTVPVNVLKAGATLAISEGGNVNDLSKFTAVIGLATDASGQNIVASTAGIISPVKLSIHLGKITKVHVKGWNALIAGLPAGTYYLTVTLIDATGNSAFAVSQQTV
jgi:Bacterial Ig-like domain (group 3)/PKD domain